MMYKINNLVNKEKTIFLATLIFSILLCLIIPYTMVKSTQTANADPATDLENQLIEAQNMYGKAANDLVEASNDVERNKAKVSEAQEKIDYCNTKIPVLQENIARTTKTKYKNGDINLIDIVLGSDTIEGFVNNVQMFAVIEAKNLENLNECKMLRQEVQEQEEVLVRELEASKEKERNLENNKAQAESLVAEAQQKLDSLKAQAAQMNLPNFEPEPQHHSGGPAPYLGDVVSTAYACIGHDYKTGGAGPVVFDCSGLVCWCYGCGGSHPWTTYDFVGCRYGWYQISAEEAVPGDVVSHREHCGIYIGGGRMIHSPHDGATVCETSVQGGMNFYRHG